MISAILGEQLSKKLRIAIWILFVILLISYSYINIKMENARKIEKGKDDTKISELTKTNQQVLEINKELLQVVKAPNFAKNPETLSKVDKIERNLSSIEGKSKAILRFSFWPKNEHDTFIDNVTVPIENGVVAVDFTAKNISTVQATNGKVWLYICKECKFVEEPQGSEKVEPPDDSVRTKRFDRLYAGVSFQPTRLKIIPPTGYNYFNISFKYACEQCPPIDNGHPQRLRVNY
jgi:predicted RND superfamily exporter protein